MKKNILTVLGTITLILICACQKDYIDSDDLTCYSEYSSHPRNNVYQWHLNQGFDSGLPGQSVLINTPGEGLWEGSIGYACIEERIPMTTCHIHYAASIPKAFTAIAILQQIEKGNLSLDSKISDYLDEKYKRYIPNVDRITIRQCLNHTSGIPDQIDEEFMTRFMNDPDYFYTQEELMAFLEGKDALWEPGEKYYYSDANYNILILILHKISGDHLSLFEEDIFRPLGLMNTTYNYDINHHTVPGLVSAYWDKYSDGSLENITLWEDAITSYFKGSGGMATNCYDLFLFLQGVFNGTLVSEATLGLIKSDTVHNPEADTWINDSYGLGFMVIHNDYGTWYGHAGRDPGAASYVFFNPENGVTLAAMTNIGTFFSMKYSGIFYGYFDEWLEEIFTGMPSE